MKVIILAGGAWLFGKKYVFTQKEIVDFTGVAVRLGHHYSSIWERLLDSLQGEAW